ncbi:MAG: hypothetical protein OXN89_14845 [Bryobacterales bacterium]|nr:hypothetical protein [Bryobacterales bacterium]
MSTPTSHQEAVAARGAEDPVDRREEAPDGQGEKVVRPPGSAADSVATVSRPVRSGS